jgi:hypothetical protein
MFWDQGQNRFQENSKNPEMHHQDHDFTSLDFQSFPLNLISTFGDLISSCLRT